MDIRVLGWRYEGIRGGLANITIDLGSEPARWTLIQMPNGTGKTTTMTLFRAAFSHEAWTPERVRSLRANDETKTGLFEVSLSIDRKLFRLQLKFDYIAGTCVYWTTRSELSGGGLEEGWLLPSDIRRLMTSEFVRLFVFDGELAKEIRTVGKDRAAAAIKTLYKIDLLSELEQRMQRLISAEQDRASSVSTASEQKGVSRWKNAVSQCKATRTRLASEALTLERERTEQENRKIELEAKVATRITSDASLVVRSNALKAERLELDKQIFDTSVQALSAFRTPAKLGVRLLDRLHALGGKLNHLKLPKTISSEFFRELAEQQRCVCGREISDVEKTAILERADLYLADDQIAVINKMKLALRECRADDATFGDLVEALKGHLRLLSTNSRALDQVELDLIEAGDTEVESWRNELAGIAAKLPILYSKLEKINTREPTRQKILGCADDTNIPMCEAELERCEKKLATATNTRNFTHQASATRRLIGKLIAKSLDGLREHVRIATNEKLIKLAPSESLQVSKIGGALELASSGLVAKEGVSEGQSLAVAYAFLTSLLADAPYKLPFIVDSPAVSLDTEVRREVGELIPELFGQMIMFVISSEREGFADAFYDRDDVRYLTIWRDAAGKTATGDGLADFRSFHSAESLT
ncbi:MAG: hypothetical protein Q8M93_04745 [Polaromonas sp.]|uniref:hypothetical protein n=1 Tax=Polaromonas sp. TaxID=1869339 RepID=UPI00272FB87F|nr:hypothetical protein [Polaromonas sp.]MDP2450748.1 hypothetical protein [Polaromonas sp.]MDP3246253.1 hypothetical protein [Polaromonas sp.]MDP3754899.1 hypothetical protein [Polaromonas sp.]